LVEVVIAIGIVAFAVLAIVGMLPVGLLNVNRAENMQATGNIVSQLRGQMQLLSFSPTNTDYIQNLTSTTNYYTLDGLPTTNNTSSVYYNGPYYYMATFAVYPVTNTTPTSPQTTAWVADSNLNTNNTLSVVVSLAYPPGIWNQTNTFSMLVARQTDQ